MHVHAYVWIITILVMGALLFFDVLVLGRNPHIPSAKECATFVGVFVGLAVLFGLGVWILQGHAAGGQFFAVWLTEYSLSIDNLFIFLILMEKFNVPRKLQQFALLVGIIVASFSGVFFIALGQAILEAWAWVFFIFGAFLLYSAIDQVREYRHRDDDDDEDPGEDGRFMAWFRRTVPATGDYRGTKFFSFARTVKLSQPRCSWFVSPWAPRTCFSPSTRFRRPMVSPARGISSLPLTSLLSWVCASCISLSEACWNVWCTCRWDWP
ncbi:integral membrane protein TerC [Cutibacterium acnes JCM 18916]|nr:integral membrane protein TerC [Cutibacterium acnes JCM 18916]